MCSTTRRRPAILLSDRWYLRRSIDLFRIKWYRRPAPQGAARRTFWSSGRMTDAGAARRTPGRGQDLRIDHRHDRRYAARQHGSDRQGEGRRGAPSPGQARVLQSDRERQGPHRRRDDRRARGAGQDFARTRRSGRADVRQHRHCACLRGGGARLQADPGDARIDVDRAPQDAGPARAPNWCSRPPRRA